MKPQENFYLLRRIVIFMFDTIRAVSIKILDIRHWFDILKEEKFQPDISNRRRKPDFKIKFAVICHYHFQYNALFSSISGRGCIWNRHAYKNSPGDTVSFQQEAPPLCQFCWDQTSCCKFTLDWNKLISQLTHIFAMVTLTHLLLSCTMSDMGWISTFCFW